jgi:hypothetical protein
MGDTSAALTTFKLGLQKLDDAVKGIQEAWNKLLDAITSFTDKVNQKLKESHWYNSFEWFTDKLKDGIEKINNLIKEIQEKFNQILDKVQRALKGGTPVISLFVAGDDWASKVEPALSMLPGNMTQEGDIDSWHGPAHDTYVNREKDQIAAVNQSISEVKNVSNWVTGVGTANVTFISDLVSTVVPIIQSLTETTGDVATAATTADVLSGQEALNDGSKSLGDVVAGIVQILAVMASHLGEVISQVNQQKTETNDWSNFPPRHAGSATGNWPQAVSA